MPVDSELNEESHLAFVGINFNYSSSLEPVAESDCAVLKSTNYEEKHSF